ncbi:MAG: tripartite tricarboxylate transporter substrate binding protein [Thermodesulfobacteriota bacterium]
MKKRFMVGLGVLLCIAFFGSGLVHAADKYPVKPIECILGVEAGADGDVIARPILQKVSEILGQPIMVVNKPGAGSSIAYRAIHDAKPDGYTFGWGSATIITNKLQGILPYDYHAFTQLGAFTTFFPIIVASTKGPRQFKTIQEVIAFGKANPGVLSMATAGIGQSWWVAATSFIEGTGLKINTIPQAGAGAVTVAQVAGGHTDLGVVALGSGKAMIEGGQVRFLATLGEKRAAAPYDQIPTVKELGYDVSWESTNFFIGPQKMPKHVTDILVKAIRTASHDPAYQKFCADRNSRWGYIPPEEVVPTFDKRRVVVREIMRKAGILKEK